MRSLLRDRTFWHAVVVLVGTMVGVGIYGIPFAFAKAGFWVGAGWLAVLAAIVCLFNLMFAELALSTQGLHQVSGYAHIWLGPWARRLMTFANVLAIYGALLAYMIVAGEFLHNVLSQFIAIDPQLYSVGFAVAWSLLWFGRLRTVASVDLVMAGFYTVTILVILVIGTPHVQVANLQGWTPEFWYLPYGILLFALAGLTAVPIQRQLVEGKERLLRPAIVTAVVAVALLYLVFAFAVVGMSGEVTSPEAISGLFGTLGQPIIILGSLLGIMTISTSYLMLGTALFETFRLDYRLRALSAWMLGVVPPILFFWSGLRNFIDIIGLVGAVAVGIESILILAAYLRARAFRLRDPELRVPVPTFVVWLLMLILAAGVVHEIVVR